MSAWKYRVDLKDVFHDENRTFEERRDEIVGRIKTAGFYDEDDEYLGELVAYIEESEDVDEFNVSWDEFYDWADVNRVWVATF